MIFTSIVTMFKKRIHGFTMLANEKKHHWAPVHHTWRPGDPADQAQVAPPRGFAAGLPAADLALPGTLFPHWLFP